ncbi:MAG: SMC family ATPase [Saprospiraceae bacterium]|nr:SMC family ATPase [Saprospiraceae bacterium]MDW8482940.1 SMC family ATPase [Saprospiraceae bacterium]
MLLHRLRLQNYRQYAELDLEFREGLVGIIGRNGAGKSTLFDAILYCLYGREEAGKSLVRSTFASPTATVLLELEFFVGQHLYRARREFQGRQLNPRAALYKNDVLVARTPKAVSEEIAKVLHMERDAFKRSVFSGQKELDELTKATREERRKLVRRMLGLERLDNIQTVIHNDTRDLRNRIFGQMQSLLSDADRAQLEANLAEGENQIAKLLEALNLEKGRYQDLREQYHRARLRFEEAKRRFDRYNELTGQLKQTQERLRLLTSRLEDLKIKLANLNEMRQQVEAQRPQFEHYLRERDRLETLEKDRQLYLELRSQIEQLASARQEAERLRFEIEESLRKTENLTTLEAAWEKKKEELASIQADLERALETHSLLKGELNALNKRLGERTERLNQLRALGRGGNCPTCLQPLLEGYDRAIDELAREIQQLEKDKIYALQRKIEMAAQDGEKLRARKRVVEEEAEQLHAEKIALEEEIQRRNYLEQEHQKWEERISSLEESVLHLSAEVNFDETAYETLKERLKTEEADYLRFKENEKYVQQELPVTLDERKAVEEQLAQTDEQQRKLIDEQQAIEYAPAEYDTARQALLSFVDLLGQQSERVQQAEKAYADQQYQIQKERERLERDSSIQRQIRDQRTEVELLEKMESLVAQFKSGILTQVGPGISREASELFSRITRGRYESIRIDDDFDFAISDGGIFYPIERFSGGEIDLANLCLRIAITKAIFDLSGATHLASFLAFDEILGSQDEERRIEIMRAFYYLKEQFRQIYIISHIESLKDFFPSILEVSLGPAGSRAVWR